MSDPSTSLAALLPELATVAGDVGDLLGGQTAERLRALTELVRRSRATAVVVGEKKRGKSQLINALLERPNLVPTDSDIATDTQIVLRHGEGEEAVAVLSGGDGERLEKPIAVSRLAEYAAVTGGQARGPHGRVESVRVRVPVSLLDDGLVLVDTPGVDGLVNGHSRITLATLERADAVLFVVNGQSELTASEVRFLRRAAQQGRKLVFVLTQTDKYRDWEQVRVKNQELLAEYAPEYRSAPWFPVSSRDRLNALDKRATNPAFAAVLERKSGFAPLVAHLTGPVARGPRVRYALLLLELADEGLRQQGERLVERAAALRPDETAAAALADAQAALERVRRQDASWRRLLSHSLAEYRERAVRTLNTELDALRDDTTSALRDDPQEVVKRLPEELDNGVRGAWLAMRQSFADGLGELTERLARELSSDGVATLRFELLLPDRERHTPDFTAPERESAGLSDAFRVVGPAMGAGGAVAAIPVVGVFVSPFVAGGVGFWLWRNQRDRQERAHDMRTQQEGTTYLRDLLSRAERDMRTDLDAAVRRCSATLTETVQDRIDARTNELNQLVTRQRSAQAVAEQRRRAEIAELNTKVTQVREIRTRARELHTRIGMLR